ncbi:MAG: glutathione peroxidase [Candidatus Lernaella stagnicola]|nr:glutathione peroxidase [Candidatus Lernaella stagnicola]
MIFGKARVLRYIVLFAVAFGFLLIRTYWQQPIALAEGDAEMTKTVYDFHAQTLDGNDASLAEYKGKVLLIVNTASKCGFTPQYEGLEKLYETYKDRGFAVLGFPCNQFRNQEPGSAAEIKKFCKLNYGVTFPMFGKIDVNGKNTHPLYVFLKNAQPGLLGSEGIKWNFTKFLVDRNGNPVQRFSPRTEPSELTDDIEKLLNQPAS